VYGKLTQVPLITDAVSFMNGGTCVVLQSGNVRCWSRSSRSTESETGPSQANVQNMGPMSGGRDSNCGILASGAVQCWGSGMRTIGGIASATALEMGDHSGCALSGGKAYCWGQNSSSKLSIATDSVNWTAQVMKLADGSDATGITSVSVGLANACVIIGGAVYCAGANDNEQIVQGTGAATIYARLTQIAGVSNAVQVAVGRYFVCARLSTGKVVCWGENAQRQTGPVATRAIQEIPGITNATDLSVGNAFGCALSGTGTITCWGDNQTGQLGNGSRKAGVPGQVVGITTAVAVRAGADFTCALLADHSVKCWGSGQFFQGGNLDTWANPNTTGAKDRLLPTPVAFLGPMTNLTTGDSHACASDASGNVFCWGDNRYGQRGSGGPTFTPVAPRTW
jgi:alpha-tubulin suppressor-like RCC1 family protein